MCDMVTFYFDQDLLSVPVNHALAYLQHHKEFSCFIDYCDPVTGVYMADHVAFQSSAQRIDDDSPTGVFVTNHKGLTIKVPADMQWWATQSKSNTWFSDVPQESEVMIGGELKTFQFKAEVAAIRIQGERVTPLKDILDGKLAVV